MIIKVLNLCMEVLWKWSVPWINLRSLLVRGSIYLPGKTYQEKCIGVSTTVYRLET